MANKLPPLGTQIVGRTSEGRPIVLNPDGSISTERSVTIEHPLINGGKPTNIPTMFRGRELPPLQAAELIAKFSQAHGSMRPLDPETGKPLQAFATIEEAEEFAKSRSKQIELEFAKAYDPEKLMKPQSPLDAGLDNNAFGIGGNTFFGLPMGSFMRQF